VAEFALKTVWERERRFVRERFADIEPGSVEWLVKNLLPAHGVAILYGASTVGKSFLILYLCIRIARGQTVLEHRSTKSGVLYIAAEGANGMRKRIKGLREKFDIKAENFQFIGTAPNLLDDDDVTALIREAQDADEDMQAETGTRLGLIVIDTTSASMPGANENTSETMSAMLSNAQKLGQATKSLVMLIAHPGKVEGLGVRGWSGQKGNSDAIIYLAKDEEDPTLRVGKVEKLKDGQDGETFAYRLKEIDMGFDADGDPITTAYPVFEQAPVPVSAKKGKTPVDQRTGPKLVLRALGQLQEVGQTYVIPPLPGVPPNTVGVKRIDLRMRLLTIGHPAADLGDASAKRMINKDISDLIAAGKLREEDGMIWRVGK
jgi:hypothetical protein